MKASQHGKTKAIMLVFLTRVAMLSCTGKHAASIALPSNFNGKVFRYAPEIDSQNLSVTGACDCCSGEYIFLSQKQFVLIDYCESDKSFHVGSYYINDEHNLVMQFTGKAVNMDYNWEREADSNAMPKHFLTTKNNAPDTVKYMGLMYKQKQFLKSVGNYVHYCVEDTSTNAQSEVTQLKQDGIWDKLMSE